MKTFEFVCMTYQTWQSKIDDVNSQLSASTQGRVENVKIHIQGNDTLLCFWLHNYFSKYHIHRHIAYQINDIGREVILKNSMKSNYYYSVFAELHLMKTISREVTAPFLPERSWVRAHKMCSAIGATLPVFRSKEEEINFLAMIKLLKTDFPPLKSVVLKVDAVFLGHTRYFQQVSAFFAFMVSSIRARYLVHTSCFFFIFLSENSD